MSTAPSDPGSKLPTSLQQNDVCCGRGKGYIKHPGNLLFQKAILANLETYASAKTKTEKSQVVASVVSDLFRRGVRFLKKDIATGQWYDIGQTLSHEKTGHAIRDFLLNRSKGNKKRKSLVPAGGTKDDKKDKKKAKKGAVTKRSLSAKNRITPGAPPLRRKHRVAKVAVKRTNSNDPNHDKRHRHPPTPNRHKFPELVKDTGKLEGISSRETCALPILSDSSVCKQIYSPHAVIPVQTCSMTTCNGSEDAAPAAMKRRYSCNTYVGKDLGTEDDSFRQFVEEYFMDGEPTMQTEMLPFHEVQEACSSLLSEVDVLTKDSVEQCPIDGWFTSLMTQDWL